VGDIIVDGKVRVTLALAVANIAAPTVAECNGGLLLSSTMTRDGMPGWEPDTARVPTTPFDGSFGTNMVGMASFGDPLLRLKKQTGTDTIYNTLVKNATGFVIVRRDISKLTAWTAGQECSVYPIECGEVRHLTREENSVSRYEVPITITDEPELRAVVAA